jgi:hypothetical protein
VRLTARAFYDDISMKGDNQPKTSRGDNRGMAVVVLDALTRYYRHVSAEPFLVFPKRNRVGCAHQVGLQYVRRCRGILALKD